MTTRHIIGQHKIKVLENNSKIAFEKLKKCDLCPRKCGVDRIKGQKGFCRAGLNPVVYSYFAHPGEEPPLSGVSGSGTIFFTHCTLHCVYCQNYPFSQLADEKEISIKELSNIIISLEKRGCHNINLVTPTHFVPQILEAFLLAAKKSLCLIPIVYNTSGYDLVETLQLLNGVVDIYLPDMRYGDDENAKRFSNALDYVKINQMAVKEMFGQVGNLTFDDAGIAKKGLIVRHLVLPNGIASTEKVFKFISQNISKDIYISLMSQYHPTYKAAEFPEINRRITKKEYEETIKLLFKYGLLNGWVQDSNKEIDSMLLGTNIKKMG
ncbi:MAG: radical SAM protein [Candidatus Omnitrophica bacterium]|nr:radical SAM protein [Candidatus Omnitrophota bacterium]